jgi:hypothetical protein
MMSLYKIKKDALAVALDGVGKDVCVEVLKVEAMYMQRDRANKLCKVLTEEIKNRGHLLAVDEKMEVYGLHDQLVQWLFDFHQHGKSSVNVTPVFKRVREIMQVWCESDEI